jgi:hypothetical protein
VTRWEAWLNFAGFALVGASGVAYGMMKYFLPAADPYSRLSSPWEPWALKLHVLAAPFLVFGLGLLLRRHALARLASGQRTGRRTGIALILVAAPVALSGYLIQVLTGEEARRLLGWSHALLGLLFLVAFAAHPRRAGEAIALEQERVEGQGLNETRREQNGACRP